MKWFMFGILIFDFIGFIISWIINDIREMIGFGIMILFITNVLLITNPRKENNDK